MSRANTRVSDVHKRNRSGQSSSSSEIIDLASLLRHHSPVSTPSNVLPQTEAFESIQRQIKSHRFRFQECISLTTLKLFDVRQEKTACYDYLKTKVIFKDVAGNIAKDMLSSFDLLCRLLVDITIFTRYDISSDTWVDLLIYLWKNTAPVISLEHFVSWWKSTKHANGSTRGELLLHRYRDQVKNLSKIWLEMLFKPDFSITCHSCYATGIWYRQYFWNDSSNSLLDILLRGQRGSSLVNMKTSIVGMCKIDSNSFGEIDQLNTPLLKLVNDYCDCLRSVFVSLEEWYLHTFKQHKEINLAMFGLMQTQDDNDIRQPVNSVKSVLKAVEEMKKELTESISENEISNNYFYQTFISSFRNLQTLFLEHETKLILSAFKFHDGHYLRQLFPKEGKLPVGVRGNLRDFFTVGFRLPFVSRFLRMIYILFFSQDQFSLDDLMKQRDIYFSKFKTNDEVILGVQVPPMKEFHRFACETFNAIQNNSFAFDILLSLIEAIDSVFEPPIEKSAINDVNEEDYNSFGIDECPQPVDDLIIEVEDDVSAMTPGSGLLSQGSNSTSSSSHRIGDQGISILVILCIIDNC